VNDPRIAIVGLGAIGGSVALALLARGIVPDGTSDSGEDAEAALVAGARVRGSLEEAVVDADIVMLAVPLDVLAPVAERVATINAGATILHAGSLQLAAALGLGDVLRARVVGTHPLAGTHGSGFAAARAEMFRGAVVSIESRAGARQREDAELLWSLAGAQRVEYRDAAAHDACMAWASHLPQLAATALAAAVAPRLGVSCPHGPGLRDTTRLAGSDWSVWRPILEAAPDETLAGLASLEQELAALRAGLATRDWPRVRETWERARQWRMMLEGER
jgi:cyclohexadieny/prephenate dehydrogenase